MRRCYQDITPVESSPSLAAKCPCSCSLTSLPQKFIKIKIRLKSLWIEIDSTWGLWSQAHNSLSLQLLPLHTSPCSSMGPFHVLQSFRINRLLCGHSTVCSFLQCMFTGTVWGLPQAAAWTAASPWSSPRAAGESLLRCLQHLFPLLTKFHPPVGSKCTKLGSHSLIYMDFI